MNVVKKHNYQGDILRKMTRITGEIKKFVSLKIVTIISLDARFSDQLQSAVVQVSDSKSTSSSELF